MRLCHDKFAVIEWVIPLQTKMHVGGSMNHTPIVSHWSITWVIPFIRYGPCNACLWECPVASPGKVRTAQQGIKSTKFAFISPKEMEIYNICGGKRKWSLEFIDLGGRLVFLSKKKVGRFGSCLYGHCLLYWNYHILSVFPQG